MGTDTVQFITASRDIILDITTCKGMEGHHPLPLLTTIQLSTTLT
jgi:hypothetical protein